MNLLLIKNNNSLSIDLDYETRDYIFDQFGSLSYCEIKKYKFTLSNINYSEVINSNNYFKLVKGGNIANYISDIDFRIFYSSDPSVYNNTFDYLIWDHPYTENSFLKITIKRCP